MFIKFKPLAAKMKQIALQEQAKKNTNSMKALEAERKECHALILSSAKRGFFQTNYTPLSHELFDDDSIKEDFQQALRDQGFCVSCLSKSRLQGILTHHEFYIDWKI